MKGRALCSLVLCLVLSEAVFTTKLLGQQSQPLNPGHQSPLSFSDAEIVVRLPVGAHVDDLVITRRNTGTSISIRLPEEMAQVDEISKGTDEKIVVRGMVNSSAAEVVIISLKSSAIIDRFTCYIPAVSPDGRYIAFIKFYPMHFSEGVEDHYMLYDLTKTPRDNRPVGVSGENWQIVGQCVYPLGVGNKEYDNIARPLGHAYLSRSHLYWTTDSRSVLFANQLEGSDKLTFVMVEVRGANDIVVKRIEQSVTALCHMVTNREGGCSLSVDKIEPLDTTPPEISVVLKAAGTPHERTANYALRQFN